MFFSLLGLFALLGVVFGWIGFFQSRELQGRVDELQRRVTTLEARRLAELKQDTAPPPATPAVTRPDNTPAPVAAPAPPATPPPPVARPRPSPAARQPSPVAHHLREHWMSWLGGICIGLAGIFLVRYSIEQGLLAPSARIALGLVGGIALHGGALWLRRRKGAHEALAALAAGGSITLFASVLAALHLYALFSPGFSFALLALVALGTMWLALLHGPVLAALGLLGAYALPVLIGGDADAAGLMLAYVLIIDVAALFLLRYVERPWLWYGVLAGTLFWWLLTLDVADFGLWRGWYLAAFVYALHAIPDADWWLRRQSDEPAAGSGLRAYLRLPPGRTRQPVLGLCLLLIAWTWSILATRFDTWAFLAWTPFTVVLMLLAGRQPHLLVLAWLQPALGWAAWLAQHWLVSAVVQEQQYGFYWYSLGAATVQVLLALRNARIGRAAAWMPMLLLPLGHLVLCWLLTENAELSLQWLLFAALLGGCYLALAAHGLRHGADGLITASFFAGGHLAYALGVAFHLREASLTLAFAAQLISLAWVIRRFGLPQLGWIFKLVVALVLCRLSLNPWLLQYANDVHWPLWSFGGSTLCCWLAARQLDDYPRLQAWARAAALHLFTLTAWAELRWFLHDGEVFVFSWTALEAGLDCALFGTLALVYHWRENFTTHLAKLYRAYSLALLGLATYAYVALLIALRGSFVWLTSAVGDTWLLNGMLLLFGVPVLLALAVSRFYLTAFRRPARWVAAGAAFIFISLQIRHFWQHSVSLEAPATAAELYTYSAVWLLLAVAAVLAGAWRLGRDVYRGGMLLLLGVVAKLFFVDMAGLEGLLRVASFLGMGLALLAIAWLHRRLQGTGEEPA